MACVSLNMFEVDFRLFFEEGNLKKLKYEKLTVTNLQLLAANWNSGKNCSSLLSISSDLLITPKIQKKY